MLSLKRVIGGGYAWLAAMFLGSVLLDVVYTSLLRDRGGAFVQPVFGEVSDFLLVLAAPTFLAGLASIALSWNTLPARTLFLASLAAISVEFIAPIVLFPILGNSHSSSIPGVSACIRLIPLGLASILALAGYRNLYREASLRAPGIPDPPVQSRGA